jgi:hypothetical protein
VADIGGCGSKPVLEAETGAINKLSESPSDGARWRRGAGDENGGRAIKATARGVAKSSRSRLPFLAILPFLEGAKKKHSESAAGLPWHIIHLVLAHTTQRV